DHSTIELPEGRFILPASLWLEGKNHVIIKGKGMDKTILSFAGQVAGAEGIKIINCTRITLQDLTVQDTKGDAIKTQDVRGMVFRNVKAEWTRGAHRTNGGYGIYPVQCSNILIEGCEARGASDAGIYVGQSQHIIVRNCRAYENVAGIEIENSMYADVYDNEVTNNTGGILVFDLPDLPVKKGGSVRVFRNYIHHNNHKNFAPKGNIVAKVPPGSGIMLLAATRVDVFENKIINNRTTGTALVSYYITENPIKDSSYDPYPDSIAIFSNEYSREPVRATGQGRMGKLFRLKLRFGTEVPHILFDGITNGPKPVHLCIHGNKEQTFANIDAGNRFLLISRDARLHTCSLPPVPPVLLPVQ
ncbi:MAG TPA: parallel beta-helix domain-containing protein, partial [Lacibacter sp.]|nr:parallel beta-helix domain-containing protein [Lacibacter sp.]